MESVYSNIGNATEATGIDFGTKVTAGGVNESRLNASMVESHSFIFTPYAFAISGVFVWSALFLACFSVSLSSGVGCLRVILKLLRVKYHNTDVSVYSNFLIHYF